MGLLGAWVRFGGKLGFERVVWVRSEGEERCWFAGILVWERMGLFFGFAGEVGSAEGDTDSGDAWGASEVGFCSGEEMVWSGFMGQGFRCWYCLVFLGELGMLVMVFWVSWGVGFCRFGFEWVPVRCGFLGSWDWG